MKKIPEYFIESPHAAESGGQRNFSHRQARFVNELLGKKHTPRLCYRDVRGSKVLKEQSSKLAFPYAKTFRQCFYACAIAIKSAVGNQSQCAGHCV